MARLFMIGLGGFIGSVARYIISGYAQNLFKNTSFPLGTAFVNIIGCFFIGVLFYLSESRGAFTDYWRSFLFVGILGGFTTFSAFSNESFLLFRDGRISLAMINIVGQILICLTAVWGGRSLAWWLWR